MVFWIVVAALLAVGLGSMLVWDRRRRREQRVDQRDVRVAEAKLASRASMYRQEWRSNFPGSYGP